MIMWLDCVFKNFKGMGLFFWLKIYYVFWVNENIEKYKKDNLLFIINFFKNIRILWVGVGIYIYFF